MKLLKVDKRFVLAPDSSPDAITMVLTVERHHKSGVTRRYYCPVDGLAIVVTDDMEIETLKPGMWLKGLTGTNHQLISEDRGLVLPGNEGLPHAKISIRGVITDIDSDADVDRNSPVGVLSVEIARGDSPLNNVLREWALECARPGGREQMSPRLAEALDSLARVRSH